MNTRIRNFARKNRLALLGAAVTLVLVGVPAAAAYTAASINHPIRDGDHVLYDFTIYDAGGEALYTTDWEKAERLIAAGNPHLLPKDEANEVTYTLRGGFLDLDGPDTNGFDHVPYLLGHREGDVVRTPVLKAPFADHDTYVIPQVVQGVKSTFWAPATLLRENITETGGSPDGFVYAMDFPAKVIGSNATHDQVKIQLEKGAVVDSVTYGFPFRVLEANDDSVDLELLLHEGDVFTTSPCGVKLGIRAGQYRVIDVVDGNFVLRPVSALNKVAGKDVSVEFEIREVKAFPDLYKAQLKAEVQVARLKASIQDAF